MTALKMKRLYGPPAEGEGYWPRPAISDPLVSALAAGESISLFGLRRTGKSSLMRAVEKGLREQGRRPVYIDVQGYDRADALVTELLKALPESAAGAMFAKVFSTDRISKGAALVNQMLGRASQPLTPRAMLQNVELVRGDLCSLLAKQNGSVVLLIDELPYLIKNMLEAGLRAGEVNGFLATLRAWRQQGRLPMLVAGSMGLSWLVREHGIAREHFNDLVPQPSPPPLDEAEARAMLRALAAGSGAAWMNEAVVTAVIEESAALYPSFLQFAFGRLADRGPCTADDVRRIFADQIRQGLDQDFYAQFDTRLSRYEGDEKTAARAVLRRMADEPESIELAAADAVLEKHAQADRDELLNAMVEDGFLTVDTRAGTMEFTSPLVRTWWNSKPYRR